ncbi:MAG: Uma2 family endonuclease [Synechococcaceae cyanobacterium SM2_3_1]|nr:Uma2 family endonuclease [Synechococcaceae cyanobacterium SM2_3_1]
MLSTTEQKLTIEEFLALPEGDITYELVDGQVIPKDKSMAPKRFHSRLQPILWRVVEDWCRDPNAQKPGSAYTEWAIKLVRNQQDWIPVPDVTYVSDQQLGSDAVVDEVCQVIPDLVIEIISPSQPFGEMTQKAGDYLKAGIPRVWIVDPAAKSITVFFPDAPPKTFTQTAVINDDSLPGLELIPQDIFEQAGIP